MFAPEFRPHPRAFAIAVTVGAIAMLASLPALGGDMMPVGTSAMSQSGSVTPPVAIGSGFTYQGRLLLSGSPADGPYDVQFKLMDAAAGGSQFGSTITFDNVAVADGRFTVQLDFGTNAFFGGGRWLAISVRPGAGGSYTALTPRQKLTPAPYAMAMPNVYTNEPSGFVGIGRSSRVSLNEFFGVQAPSGASSYGGMYVNTESADGWPFYGYASGGTYHAWTYYNPATSEWRLDNGGTRLIVREGGGLEIANTSSGDAITINHTADDGVQMGDGTNYPDYGIWIPGPGTTNFCFLVSTADPSNNYALYTPDNIHAGNVTFTSEKVIARVDNGAPLSPGDVVVAAGVDTPLDGGDRIVLVQRAGRSGGVIGVVASRLAWRKPPGKGDADEMVLMPVDGTAHAGDYVTLVTQGVTDVRVPHDATITKGIRVTARSADGGVRALQDAETGPALGVALADAHGGDTVPVFVSLH